MKEAKKDNPDGCYVAFLIFIVVIASLISYHYGSERVVSKAQKEVLKAKEVRQLQEKIKNINEHEKFMGKIYNEEYVLKAHRISVILKDIESLSDTLHLVTSDYVRDVLNNIKYDILKHDEFD